ncbi:MAG: hypothetical protein KDB23_33120, partial [Planctomycetales bacterium]|nr:hypothetical protein [Planctomycetales bacterium]
FLLQGMFLARFGFWAWLVSGFVHGLLNSPITTNSQAFYFHTGIFNLVLAFAVAAWGAFYAVGGVAGLSAGLDGKARRQPSNA